MWLCCDLRDGTYVFIKIKRPHMHENTAKFGRLFGGKVAMPAQKQRSKKPPGEQSRTPKQCFNIFEVALMRFDHRNLYSLQNNARVCIQICPKNSKIWASRRFEEKLRVSRKSKGVQSLLLVSPPQNIVLIERFAHRKLFSVRTTARFVYLF